MTPRRRGGFTMIHMMFVLGLLGAFAVAGARVFRLSVLSGQSASRAQERALRLEQAVRVMRADVWQGSAVQVSDGRRLRIGEVEWSVDAAGTVTRAFRKETARWPELNLRFEAQGSAVLMKDRDRVVAVLRRGSQP